jgi:hypothetical protein
MTVGLLVIAVAGVAAFIATFEISLHPRLVASDVSISNWPGAGSAGDGKSGCRAAPPSAAIVGTLRGDSSRTG